MWIKGWRCTECGHEDNPLYRHNCYLRQGASEMPMIASDLGRGLRAAGIEIQRTGWRRRRHDVAVYWIEKM
jgi:hypothetical protein